MVKIRLKRMGMKKKPFYRIVVADERTTRDGRPIDEIGYYNPVANPAWTPRRQRSGSPTARSPRIPSASC